MWVFHPDKDTIDAFKTYNIGPLLQLRNGWSKGIHDAAGDSDTCITESYV